MRSIDRFAGVPLCWAAAGLSMITRRRRIRPIAEWEHVLVLKFFGLGSLLLSAPFLTRLKEAAPRCRITYVTFSPGDELADRLDQVDRTLEISTSSIRAFARDAIRALRTLRRTPIDASFDLEFFSKFSTLLAVCSGAAARTGYALPPRWRRANLTHSVQLDRGSHVSEMFLRLLEPFGVTGMPTPPYAALSPTRVEIASMQNKLHMDKSGAEIWCVNINAGSASLERRWPPERFLAVVRTLAAERPGSKYYFIGSAEESASVAAALAPHRELNQRLINCAGLLTIGELIALLHRSVLLLTNDSGPMHVASASGTPVVALFGPESPVFYGPRGPSRIIYKAVSCSPCLNIYNAKAFRCPFDARCMKEIETDEVLAAVRHMCDVSSVEVA